MLRRTVQLCRVVEVQEELRVAGDYSEPQYLNTCTGVDNTHEDHNCSHLINTHTQNYS